MFFLGGSWTLIPAFCGSESFCQQPIEKALEKAQGKIKNKYYGGEISVNVGRNLPSSKILNLQRKSSEKLSCCWTS